MRSYQGKCMDPLPQLWILLESSMLLYTHFLSCFWNVLFNWRCGTGVLTIYVAVRHAPGPQMLRIQTRDQSGDV